MKLFCLSSSCFVLCFKNISILLDAPLNFSNPPPGFGGDTVCIPELTAYDLKQVDVVLISNYQNIMALPYIVQTPGFTGMICCTEPTFRDGKILMEEITSQFEVRLPPRHSEIKEDDSYWRQFFCQRKLFSREDAESALSEVVCVNFHQKIPVSHDVSFTAVSSGFCLGSVNWIIENCSEKIAFVSSSSDATSRCCKPMDLKSLHGSDVMIFSDLENHQSQGSPETAFRNFCQCIKNTLSTGGSAVVQLPPLGLLYDLLVQTVAFLDNLGDKQTPIFLTSPLASRIVAQQVIYTEWYSHHQDVNSCQRLDKLIDTGRIKIVEDIGKRIIRQQCIIFAGHSSLRFGEFLHFVSKWGGDSKNALLLTDPSYCSPENVEHLKAVLNVRMKIAQCPINVRLSMKEVKLILADVAPKISIIPKVSRGLQMSPGDKNFSSHVISYSSGSVLNVPLQHLFENSLIDKDVGDTIAMKKISNLTAPIYASLIEATLYKNEPEGCIIKSRQSESSQMHDD